MLGVQNLGGGDVVREQLGGADRADVRGDGLGFLWDVGLQVGHSTRTLQECVTQARSDITVVTNLMEARFLSGDPTLLKRLAARVSPERMWSPRKFFEAKREEQVQRHQRYGETAYNLEPHVKEGPGGLRDIQTIQWVAP